MLKTSSRVKALLGDAVEVLLVSLRSNYVNHLVKICFTCLFLVSRALLSENAVIRNFFVLNSRHLSTSNLSFDRFILLPLEVFTGCTFKVL